MFWVVSGAVMAVYWVAALFFLRFWSRTKDRLFAAFALAFALLGIERVVLGIWENPNEAHVSVYLIRLTAFLILILAIIDKNRGRRETEA
jgi:hypothetical protein